MRTKHRVHREETEITEKEKHFHRRDPAADGAAGAESAEKGKNELGPGVGPAFRNRWAESDARVGLYCSSAIAWVMNLRAWPMCWTARSRAPEVSSSLETLS